MAQYPQSCIKDFFCFSFEHFTFSNKLYFKGGQWKKEMIEKLKKLMKMTKTTEIE